MPCEDHSTILDSLENQKSILPDIKIHIVSCLISHIGSEIPSYKGVPVSVVLSVQLIFEMSGDLLNSMHLVQSVPSYS